uniref:Uncharacterized protein n=1 Tax=Anguilla anguilla TaxID=7936 RepID=A0A0E9RJ96_ANGAN
MGERMTVEGSRKKEGSGQREGEMERGEIEILCIPVMLS